jgi:hypothetical protein
MHSPPSHPLPRVTLALLLAPSLSACDLCAIYRASDARGEFASGFTATIAQQFIPFRTEQFDGQRFNRPDAEWLDRSMTHLVLGWNPSPKLGFSANLPIAHLRYNFTQVTDGFTPERIEGQDTGPGDLALVARWQLLDKSVGKLGFVLNLLGGLKLPTGSADALDRQAVSIDQYEAVVGPGHDHDSLGQVLSGIHLHDIALGSGSVDAIFGITGQVRWKRVFLNHQWQYYLRTEGAGHYRYGNEFIGSGGPGAYLWLSKTGSLSLQYNTVYDTRGSDEYRGRPSVHTGYTAWYGGPQAVLTWGDRFSTVFSVDIPLRITGRGFQNVPDYRINGTLSVRF